MDYPISWVKKRSFGFTLIETMVTISIIAILAATSFSAYTRFTNHEHLEIATGTLVDMLRTAQVNARSGKEGSPWGVEIQSGSATLFKGVNYVDRDVSVDYTTRFSRGVVASGLSEIVFQQITGSTEDIGDIMLTNSYGTKNISINAKGVVSY